LYQKQLECRVSGGIASLQFEMYSHNGYDKDLLLVGMEDSTIYILEEETGKLLNTNPVQTNKPSRALLMQTLGELYGLVYPSIFLFNIYLSIFLYAQN
jgi:hypothetical protein